MKKGTLSLNKQRLPNEEEENELAILSKAIAPSFVELQSQSNHPSQVSTPESSNEENELLA